MQVWRICAERHRSSAFSGTGSLRFPGRWHKGLPIVYTASSLSLASIELFVNLETPVEPQALVRLSANVPDDLMGDQVLEADLPDGWWTERHPACLATGMAWASSGRSVALLVPSAVTPGEQNILLNPLHPDFARVGIGEAQPFRFDPRMFRRA